MRLDRMIQDRELGGMGQNRELRVQVKIGSWGNGS